MSKTILHIESSALNDASLSRRAGAYLAEKLGGEVIHRDLNDTLPLITEAWIGANYTPAEQRSDDMKALLSVSDTLLAELKSADILIIGAPMYNFSIPTSLKAWIDMICRVNETFSYSEEGPKGLLSGKKAYVVLTSGGVPVGSPADFVTPYLKQVLGFIGVTDIEIIAGERTSIDAEAARKAAFETVDKLVA